jgi:DNA-binding Xre family transcriptional regulator
MRDFRTIVKVLKDYLSQDKKDKIYDKNLAKELGISQVNFATLKKRNSIPYQQIIIFCHKKGICSNEIFFN